MTNELLMAGILIGGFIFFLIFLLFAVGVLLTIFWILMIIDCAKRDFAESTEKVVWLIVVIIFGVLGAIVYYFAVKRPQERGKHVKAAVKKASKK